MTGGRLEGKTVLVTGASSGIGRETALRFAESGATVVAVARRAELLEELASVSRAAVFPVPGDLADPEFVDGLAADRDVDVLVNAAGCTAHAPFLEADPALWERAWRLNVHALMCLTQAVARRMARRRSGHIINVSSVLARQVYPFTLAYAATKHATAAITRGLRVELAEFGIRVTEVAPGLVDTGLMDEVEHPEVRQAYAARRKERIPAGEVARAIVFAAGAAPGTVPELVTLNPHAQL